MFHSDAYTDVVELCALLQCLGFSVKSMDTGDSNMSQDGGTRTVVINCQEFGCTLLGSLPKAHRERLTKELHEMIRCIKDHNESVGQKERKTIEKTTLEVKNVPKAKEDKSASMNELKTPEKLLFELKSDTPTHYRSLDTLTACKQAELPAPGPLQRTRLHSQSEDLQTRELKMCERQSTYTLASTPGSVRRRNKTSSPIHGLQNSMLDRLTEAEKLTEALLGKLSCMVRDYADDCRNDSSMSSLALDVSKISVLKAPETSRLQFASSPNLSGILAREEFAMRTLKRMESASTSNLAPKSLVKESKMARLKRISPKVFKTKKDSSVLKDRKKEDGKSKLNSLWKPKIIIPVQKPRTNVATEPCPNLSAASKKKFSHIKSTIPRPAKKE